MPSPVESSRVVPAAGLSRDNFTTRIPTIEVSYFFAKYPRHHRARIPTVEVSYFVAKYLRRQRPRIPALNLDKIDASCGSCSRYTVQREQHFSHSRYVNRRSASLNNFSLECEINARTYLLNLNKCK